MFAQVHTPDQLTPRDLDSYLERGWFRMGQTIFTTNFLHARNEMYSTIWLRILLNEYGAESTQLKLCKRNSAFRTLIGPATLTPEKEALYSIYKESVPFQASKSLDHLLFFGRKEEGSIYATYEVTVYDGDQLIACGFFDLGENSAQGIASFYDPAYKKYSLGKYLIYSKIQYCKDLKLCYFYPGYFVPGNSHFDYKLAICKPVLQFFSITSQTWLPIKGFSDDNIPFKVMQSKLVNIQIALAKAGIECSVKKYEFFDVDLMPELRDNGLFDFPVFLFFGNDADDSIDSILVFDVRDGLYHLFACIPVWKPNETNPDREFYSIYILNVTQEIYSTNSEIEMAAVVVTLKRK
jgi:leucyl-tRNA---protein transferase